MNPKQSMLFSRLVGAQFFRAAALAALVGMPASLAQADPITFNVVQSASQIDLTASGSLLDGALTVDEQFPDSPTRYMGTIETNLTETSLGFPGGSDVDADVMRNNSNTPRQVTPNVGGGAGTAPANYGVTMTAPVNYVLPPIDVPDFGTINLVLKSVNASMALRDIMLDVNASSLPLSALPSPQSFAASDVALTLTGNADIKLDAVLETESFLVAIGLTALLQSLAADQPDLGITVSHPSVFSPDVVIGFGSTLVIPSTVVDNSLANPGTLAHVGSNYELTIPVNFGITPDLGDVSELFSIDLALEGQLFATAPYVEVAVPEPSSMLLAASAAAGLGLVALRRKRRRG